MKVEILGTGCPKCKKLMQLTQEAVLELGMGTTASLTKVEKIEDIMNYGVMMTPALVIDGKVAAAGRIPSKNDIKKLLSEAPDNSQQAGQTNHKGCKKPGKGCSCCE